MMMKFNFDEAFAGFVVKNRLLGFVDEMRLMLGV